ncbi:MAG: hypothetical protein R3C19_21705 [Planctomycetaceae bacterium]
MARSEQRKKSVVDARMQWTLAMRFVMHFCTFIVGGAVFGLIAQFMTDPFRGLNGHLQSFWSNNGPYMVALLCLLPIFIRDTLTVSNRIVGPICRLRDTVKHLSNNESVPPLKFRKGDMWNDLPDSFNKMVSVLRNSGSDPVEEAVRELHIGEAGQTDAAAQQTADEQELAEV